MADDEEKEQKPNEKKSCNPKTGRKGNTSLLPHDVMAPAGFLLFTPHHPVLKGEPETQFKKRPALGPSAASIIQAITLLPSIANKAMYLHSDSHALHP